MVKLEGIIKKANEVGASDILITEGYQIKYRIVGKVVDSGIMLDTNVYSALVGQITKNEIFEPNRINDKEFSYIDECGIRYRVNSFNHINGTGYAIRLPYTNELKFTNLRIPAPITRMVNNHSGIIIISGHSNSGKSTTAAAILSYLNSCINGHIMTIEKNIEYAIKPEKCLVTQRLVSKDTNTYELVHMANRENVDVLYIDEINDALTIRRAIESAEAGMLVVTTTHTHGVDATVEYIYSLFNSNEQLWIQRKLANNLLGILSQALVPVSSRKYRVLATELLVTTSEVQVLLRNGVITLSTMLDEHHKEGMHTIESDLANLVRGKQIGKQVANTFAVDKIHLQHLI